MNDRQQLPPPAQRQPPLFIVINAASGAHDAQATQQQIESLLRRAGRPHEIMLLHRGMQVDEAARQAVARAMAQAGVVVAAGGDGTINAVAQAAHAAGCPMGVLPQGTFNFVGRNYGIPLDTADATLALLDAQLRPVQLGQVGERVFLVNASLGLYPELLEDREKFKHRFGRNRMVAIAAALVTALRHHRQLRLRVDIDGQVRQVRTPTLLVGNNRLQLEQVGIEEAPAVEAGRMAAIMVRPVGSWALLGLALRGALGTLGDAERIESFAFRHMTVEPAHASGRRRIKVALDGEIAWMRVPLEFKVAQRPLYLLTPRLAAAALPSAGTSHDGPAAAHA